MIKSKALVLGALFAASSFFMISCGSTPAEEPAPVEDKAETEETKTETPEEPATETVEDTSAEDAAKALAEKISALWSDIDSARKEAVESGADKAAPKVFGEAESEYEKLKEGTPTEADLAALKARYAALKHFADAKAKKEKIDRYGLASYKQIVYDEGAKLIDELSGENSLTSAEWGTKAVAADTAMTVVLETGLRAKAREEREAAVKALKDANSVKCYVSRKAEYDTFVNAFKSGDQNYATKNPEGALEKYTKAKEGFAGLYASVSDARAKAQAILDEARKRVEASEKTAVQADIDKPLGDEPVEGIEAEDAKLLEDDDYSESEASEVDPEAEAAPEEDDVEKLEKAVESAIENAGADIGAAIEAASGASAEDIKSALDVLEAK